MRRVRRPAGGGSPGAFATQDPPTDQKTDQPCWPAGRNQDAARLSETIMKRLGSGPGPWPGEVQAVDEHREWHGCADEEDCEQRRIRGTAASSDGDTQQRRDCCGWRHHEYAQDQGHHHRAQHVGRGERLQVIAADHDALVQPGARPSPVSRTPHGFRQRLSEHEKQRQHRSDYQHEDRYAPRRHVVERDHDPQY